MKKLLIVVLLMACNQRPNPSVVWPPMPGYEVAPISSADAGVR